MCDVAVLSKLMSQTKKSQPRVVASETLYKGRVFSVSCDTIEEDGNTYKREVVRHHGSAVIIPVFDDGTVALVKQYRHPAVKYLVEAPAGTLNVGEDPKEGAARELEEELGVVATRLEKLSEFFVSPGFLDEKMWVFLATGFTKTQQNLDEDEFIDIVRIPFSQALEMIQDGEIEDAKTIVGLLLAAPLVTGGVSEGDYPVEISTDFDATRKRS